MKKSSSPDLPSEEPEKSINNPCLIKKSQPFIGKVARYVSHIMDDSNWKCELQILSGAGGEIMLYSFTHTYNNYVCRDSSFKKINSVFYIVGKQGAGI